MFTRTLGTLLALGLSAIAFAAHAQTTYRVQRIDTPPGALVFDLNNKGDMVGSDGPNAYLWKRPGKPILLPTLTGGPVEQNAAVAINDRREIVGNTQVDGRGRSFFLRHKRIREIDRGAASFIFVADINNAGQVVGDVYAPEPRAFLWQAGTMQVYDGPSGALNDLGEVVSGAILGSNQILQGGVVSTLQLVPGRGSTFGLDINNHSQVVGWSQPGGGGGVPSAAFWQSGQTTLLPALEAGVSYYAYSINDSEVIVGFSEDVGVEARALVWLNGTVYALRDLVRAEDRPFVNLRLATRVNNRGQILAVGVDLLNPSSSGQFLLTPVGRGHGAQEDLQFDDESP